MMVYTFNPSTQETEPGGSRILGEIFYCFNLKYLVFKGEGSSLLPLENGNVEANVAGVSQHLGTLSGPSALHVWKSPASSGP